MDWPSRLLDQIAQENGTTVRALRLAIGLRWRAEQGLTLRQSADDLQLSEQYVKELCREYRISFPDFQPYQ
jgi:ribosome-interacting GTPase 1